MTDKKKKKTLAGERALGSPIYTEEQLATLERMRETVIILNQCFSTVEEVHRSLVEAFGGRDDANI